MLPGISRKYIIYAESDNGEIHMVKDQRLRIAVAGLGRIAWQYHIPSIATDPRFQLIAVADPLMARLEEAKSAWGVTNIYQELAVMLGNEKPDILVIASPTCFHAEQILLAFQHDVDVICEKPLACSLREAEKIQETIKQRKLMVYQPHRLTPEAKSIKKILDSEILGEIFMVRRSFCNYSRRNDWQAFRKNGGGMLNNYGSHFLDQFIYLFGGGFEAVSAVTKNIASCGDAEDFVKIMAVNRCNIALDLEINMGSAFARNEWIVYGTHGTAFFDAAESKWQLKYFDPEKLKAVNPQHGLAAEGRMYSDSADITWMEKAIPTEEANTFPNGFYDFCYGYFALDEAPLVPFENTMEVMKTLELCRKSRSADSTGTPDFYIIN